MKKKKKVLSTRGLSLWKLSQLESDDEHRSNLGLKINP
jgi:hypothetical protein